MTEIINRNEWRVIGMSRSGSHAIINWLLAQIRGRVCFLNCVEPKYNPFATARPLENGLPYQANYSGFDLQREQAGSFSPRDYLIASHEDCFLGLFRDGPWEEQHDRWVGRSGCRRDLLILRDPYNLFASRLKSGYGNTPETAIRIWKQHAREFLGLRRYLPRPPVLISYNQWTRSHAYRRQLAEQLELEFCDDAFHVVPQTAGGSSFDGVKFCGRASQMKVFDRWREFAGEDRYWQLFDDQVVQLAEAAFGDLPAAERFRRDTAPASADSRDPAARQLPAAGQAAVAKWQRAPNSASPAHAPQDASAAGYCVGRPH